MIDFRDVSRRADTGARTLVGMAGPPGAGKSAVAVALGERLVWPVVDKDVIKSALLESMPEEFAGRASYDVMFDVGESLLGPFGGVILDSPLGYRSARVKAELIAGRRKARLKLILCVAPRALRNKRMAARLPMASQWTRDNGTHSDDRSFWLELLGSGVCVLDTSDVSVTDGIEKILDWLGT